MANRDSDRRPGETEEQRALTRLHMAQRHAKQRARETDEEHQARLLRMAKCKCIRQVNDTNRDRRGRLERNSKQKATAHAQKQLQERRRDAGSTLSTSAGNETILSCLKRNVSDGSGAYPACETDWKSWQTEELSKR